MFFNLPKEEMLDDYEDTRYNLIYLIQIEISVLKRISFHFKILKRRFLLCQIQKLQKWFLFVVMYY